jgi:threonine dehydratase
MAQRLRGEPVVCANYTVAEGIAVREPGELTAEILRDRLDDIVLVSERELEDSILLLLQIEKTLVEGAGAAGLAALIQRRDQFQGRRVGLLLCGGNIDLMSMAAIIQRGLVRGGQLVSMRIEARDVPGTLAQISACIGEHGGNIMEVHHRRGFGDHPLQTVAVDFLLRTRGPRHSAEIVAAVEAIGCRVTLLRD